MSTELSTGKNMISPELKKQMKLYGASFVIMLFLVIGFLPTSVSASVLYSYLSNSTSGRNTSAFGYNNNYNNPYSNFGYSTGVYFQPTSDITGVSVMRFFITGNNNGGGNPTDNVIVKVYSTTDGSSVGSLLATSDTFIPTNFEGDWNNSCLSFINSVDVTSDCFTSEINFSTPINFSSGGKYLILAERTGSVSATNFFYFSRKNSGTNSENANWMCNSTGSSCGTNSSYEPVWFILESGTPPPPVDYSTRIIDMTPANGAVVGNSVDFGLHAYVNEADLGSVFKLRITLHNIDQNVLLLSSFSPSDIVLYDDYATTSGDFYFATTTTIGDGNYRLEATLQNTNSIVNWLSYGISSYFGIKDKQSTQFTVNEGTFIGNISQNSYSQIGQIFASSTATSTAMLAQTCFPFSGQFDTNHCLAYLFIPDAGMIKDTLDNFRDNVSTHFPLGYITDFITIMSTSTVGSLPSIHATLPSALQVGTPTLDLELTGVLDPILNADMGEFSTSSETFYEVTSYYWNIAVYVLLAFYLISRILGSWIMPNIDLSSFNIRNL